MKLIRSLLFSISFLASSFSASASQEGISPIESFSVTAFEEGSPVTVSGEASRGVVSALRISAFEKNFVLAPEQLAELKGFVFNGIQLSSEGGYKGFGGRVLNIVLIRGWVGSTVTKAIISVEEEGEIKIKLGKAQQ